MRLPLLFLVLLFSPLTACSDTEHCDVGAGLAWEENRGGPTHRIVFSRAE